MSFCRWSSLDFRCDLYVWEGEFGVTVAVAAQRPQFTTRLPSPLPPLPEQASDAEIHDWVQKRIARDRRLHKILDTTEFMPIGLSRDGEVYDDLTLDEAADLIDSLTDEGYVAPEGLANRLREYAQEPVR